MILLDEALKISKTFRVSAHDKSNSVPPCDMQVQPEELE
jgi:hypothetical protein